MTVGKAAFGLSSVWMAPVCGGHLPLPQGKSTNKAISLAMYHLFLRARKLYAIKESQLHNKTPAELKYDK